MKTGNTTSQQLSKVSLSWPQWSPVMKTGTTEHAGGGREALHGPQWSPVMKTGNTRRRLAAPAAGDRLNGARS